MMSQRITKNMLKIRVGLLSELMGVELMIDWSYNQPRVETLRHSPITTRDTKSRVYDQINAAITTLQTMQGV